MIKRSVIGFFLGVFMLVTFSVSAQAAVDMFLWIEGVEGEFSFNGQAGWMVVQSFTITEGERVLWKGTNETFNYPKGMDSLPAGSSFVLLKEVDKCSPRLAQAFTAGTKFPKMKLALMGTIGDKEISYEIVLEEAQIKNLTTKGQTHRLEWSWGMSHAGF